MIEAQKESLQLTQDADAQERSQTRDHGVQASTGFVGHDYARAAIQSDSGSVKKEYQAEHQAICGTRKQQLVTIRTEERR
ncbi:hypothetical protein AO724_07910 [Aeromonas allosaccharophila]|nr:hypothetical protein AO724_07910 [Aeromonas allosaccharophila]